VTLFSLVKEVDISTKSVFWMEIKYKEKKRIWGEIDPGGVSGVSKYQKSGLAREVGG
jgi:hypothetical protein